MIKKQNIITLTSKKKFTNNIKKNIKKISKKKNTTIISNTNTNTNIKHKFDLSKEYPEYKKFNLQQNLDIFYNKYGNTFYIIYNTKKFLVEMVKIMLLNNKYYYKIKYKENYNSINFNFIIDFRTDSPNCSYIANIIKSILFSGTELVKICLEINRILGAEKTFLIDKSEVICKEDNNLIDLKLIKLLENNKSFYMKLGFEFDKNIYYNKNEINKIYNNLINNLKKIKCETFIKELKTITKFIIFIINNYKHYYENIDKISIIYPYNYDNEIKNIDFIKENSKSIEQIYKIEELLKILKNNTILLTILTKEIKNQIYFYEFLVYLFKKKCYKYNIFMKYFLKPIINIEFLDTIYSLKTKILFHTFIDMLNMASFVYYF